MSWEENDEEWIITEDDFNLDNRHIIDYVSGSRFVNKMCYAN